MVPARTRTHSHISFFAPKAQQIHRFKINHKISSVDQVGWGFRILQKEHNLWNKLHSLKICSSTEQNAEESVSVSSKVEIIAEANGRYEAVSKIVRI